MRDISSVREFLESRRFTILWSGGKDSTAALLWILENIPHSDYNILYVEITGNTHELCNRYIRRIARQLGISGKLLHKGRRDMDFFDCLLRWGPPILGGRRWCLHSFKDPIIEKYSYTVRVNGIRREESTIRMKAQVIELFKNTQSITVKPIFYWSKRRVLEYLREWNIPLNPCYGRFGHGGNCMFCPYYREVHIMRTYRDDKWRRKIARIIVRLWRERERLGRQQVKIVERWLRCYRQAVF